MTEIEVIGFDADDTLWHNEILYVQAKDKYKRLLSNHHNPEWIGRKLDEREIRNLQSYGYGIKSFALSMIETAIELTEGQITGGEIQQVIDFARDMLSAKVLLLEHAEQTLAELSADHALMLITKGDLFEQERKVKRSGLARYFRTVEVVSEKTVESYRSVMKKYDIDPRCFLMVGNSIRSDIAPVVAMGGQAVYIPYPDTWAHETTVDHTLEKTEYCELEHLGQLPALVDRLIRHKKPG
jgi:putative hydrolase of the HAD superfamily